MRIKQVLLIENDYRKPLLESLAKLVFIHLVSSFN